MRYFALLVACGVVAACTQDDSVDDADSAPPIAARQCTAPPDAPVAIAAGTFSMGQEDVYAQEEGPMRETRVDAFWIDPHEVTNRQFAEFVEDTGYVTVAEKPVDPAAFGVPVEQIPPDLLLPGSAVFTPPQGPARGLNDWWTYVPGASWKRPLGPGGADAAPDEPVVHLAYEDMEAYAAWAGGRLPTEAEWEFAAKAGSDNYSEQPGPELANSWQGVFPAVNEGKDGFTGLAPVGCYPANDNGLYDMVGNVWEVTADYFRPGHDPAQGDNPRGPTVAEVSHPAMPGLASRVMKGGSYLCAPNYCMRYRPSSRQPRDPGMGASNVGFRLAYDRAPDAG